jgi:DNA-binding FrmR family transcriptional regulator
VDVVFAEVETMMDQKGSEATIARLKKVEGQIRGIQKMLQDGRYCIDIVMQLRAAEAALHRAAEVILRRHLETCVTSAFRSGDEKDRRQKVEELMKVYSKMSFR